MSPIRALLASVCLTQAGMAAPSSSGKPNVLILLASELRADCLGRVDEDRRSLTPKLDELSRQGLVFQNAYCPGATTKERGVCRRAALFTGRSPLHASAKDPGTLATMPSYFKACGYSTCFIGEPREPDQAVETQFEKSLKFERPENGTLSDAEKLIADAAISQLNGMGKAQPWLLCIAFPSASRSAKGGPGNRTADEAKATLMPANFTARPPTFGGKGEAASSELDADEVSRRWIDYIGRLKDLDEQCGRVMAHLKDSGALANTVVLLTSDTGTQLGSHGLLGRENLYDETMRVPLVISGPMARPGLNGSLISLTDVFPTLIELTGGTVPLQVDGRSLAPLLSGERRSIRTSLFLCHRGSLRAVRDERWKLIVHAPSGGLELYDLVSDALEQRNLAGGAEHTERIGTMLLSMRQWQQAMGDFLDLPEAALKGR